MQGNSRIGNVRVFIRWTNSNTRRRKVSEVPSSRLQLIVYVSGKLNFTNKRIVVSVFYRPSNRHTLASDFALAPGDGDCTCFSCPVQMLRIRRWGYWYQAN